MLNEAPTAGGVVESPLSLEEERLLQSLDRLDRRLLGKHKHSAGAAPEAQRQLQPPEAIRRAAPRRREKHGDLGIGKAGCGLLLHPLSASLILGPQNCAINCTMRPTAASGYGEAGC